ncbi:MAG TPA: hypothetical protein VFF06_20415 [Polyangia bacterium]|nr:hypothetical protein [Polyangia bacterium]
MRRIVLALALAGSTFTHARAESPPPNKAELAGKVLALTIGGKTYSLSKSAVYHQGSVVEIHFDQPSADGNTQLWIIPSAGTDGRTFTVKGSGMDALFLQLDKPPKRGDNVSNDCRASGTLTFDKTPEPGKPTSGAVDVTITCRRVPQIPEPIVVRGKFADVPYVKPSGG